MKDKKVSKGRMSGAGFASGSASGRGAALTKTLIIMGLLFILAALSLVGYNVWRSMRASIDANAALQQMEFDAAAAAVDKDAWKQNPEMELPEVEIDGIWYVGALEIPSQGLQLPVASYWDEGYAKSAPCRYVGSPYTGDLIIAGHNYRQHFGKLRNLQPGDAVYFTDICGNTFAYTVVTLETVDGTDISTMKAGSGTSLAAGSGSSSGGTSMAGSGVGSGSSATGRYQDSWDLTLFTCNFSGQARIAVRCVEP